MAQPTETSETPAETASPRVSVRLRARISTIDPETDPFTGKPFFRTSEETSANLSRGGVFVSTLESIPPGRRVLVELEMPGGRSVQAVGRVAWTRVPVEERGADSPAGQTDRPLEPGVGVQFLGGPRGDLQALDRFVSRSIRARSVSAATPAEIAPTRR
jgi:hypothetical protein